MNDDAEGGRREREREREKIQASSPFSEERKVMHA